MPNAQGQPSKIARPRLASTQGVQAAVSVGNLAAGKAREEEAPRAEAKSSKQPAAKGVPSNRGSKPQPRQHQPQPTSTSPRPNAAQGACPAPQARPAPKARKAPAAPVKQANQASVEALEKQLVSAMQHSKMKVTKDLAFSRALERSFSADGKSSVVVSSFLIQGRAPPKKPAASAAKAAGTAGAAAAASGAGAVTAAPKNIGEELIIAPRGQSHINTNIPTQGHWLPKDAAKVTDPNKIGIAKAQTGINTKLEYDDSRTHTAPQDLTGQNLHRASKSNGARRHPSLVESSSVDAFALEQNQLLSGGSRPTSKRSQQAARRLRKLSKRPHIPTGRRRFVHLSFWKWCLITVFTLLLVAGGVAYHGYQQFNSIATYVVPARSEPFELKDGATVSRVVHRLADDAYHPRLLDLWVKLNHFNYPVIQKGSYLVDGQKTLGDLLADMREGNIIKIKLPTVAFIEGMTANMVKKRLLSNTELVQDPQLASIFESPSYFIERTLVRDMADVSLLEAIGGAHNSLEGLLMPATYEYIKEQYTTTYLVQQSLLKMAAFMRDNYIERNPAIDEVISSPYEVLILASLVERESSLASERPLIAGVFINRLKAKIRLQTDPAVMYGVSPDFKGPLKLSQLKKDTPYNTYTRAGLPPTPIAMPSESAILAVLNPSETDYLYFVAKGPDPKLGHYFSTSLSEHNQAVKKYREAVRLYKQKQIKLEQQAPASQNTDLAQQPASNSSETSSKSLTQNQVQFQISAGQSTTAQNTMSSNSRVEMQIH